MNNLIKNIGVTIIYQLVAIVTGFIVPKIIIQVYGSDINGLLSSITQFLAYIYLVEGGIGSVIKYLLYKPISEGNKKQIEKILKSTKKFLKHILYAYIVYVIILCIFYPKIVADKFEMNFTITLIVVIAFSRFSEYFLSMEYSLLIEAKQQKYINSIIEAISILINAIITILLAKLKCSIIFIKFITAIVYISRALFYKIYVNNKYKIKISKETKMCEIKQKKDAFAQQIANIIHNNIDVVLITYFLGTTEVSIYVVYTLVLKGIKSIVSAIISGIDSLFGDMFAKKEYEFANKRYILYQTIYYSIITFLYTMCLILIIPFTKVYTNGITDANYYRPVFAIIITLSDFVWAIKLPSEMLVASKGHFRQTNKIAYTEAICNVIISTILITKLGIVGVAIGTLIAMLVKAIYVINYVSKRVLRRKISVDIKFIFIIILQVLLIIPIGTKIKSYVNVSTYLDWFILAIKIGIISILIIGITELILNYRKIISRRKNSC